jgi:hypothetical protein
MGFKLQQDPNERWFGQYFTTPNDVWANRIELLHFDTDWNWLMQVVEKIESLGYFFNSAPFIDDESGNLTGEYFCIIQHLTTNLTNCDYFIDVTNCYSKIEAVYNACVEFVKWYNKNK